MQNFIDDFANSSSWDEGLTVPLRTMLYETYLPRTVMLEDGSVIAVSGEDAVQGVFSLYIPPIHLDELVKHLRSKGFETPEVSLGKGEKYNLRIVIQEPWELHVRIYDSGMVEGEVEVKREYIEHLLEPWRSSVIYEVFQFYQDLYPTLHILYKPRGLYVVKVLDHYRVELKPPESLTLWKPIVIGGVLIGVLGLIAYFLSKLEKPGE